MGYGCAVRISLMFLLPAIPLSLHAQGYGGANAGYGGQTSGLGGYGGASIARVAVAPMAAGGGAQGWSNGGGAQGFGGGGLHGVTRRTFMFEPNLIAAQFFNSAGVSVASPATPGASTAYGAPGGFATAPRGGVPSSQVGAAHPAMGTQAAANAARGGWVPGRRGGMVAAVPNPFALATGQVPPGEVLGEPPAETAAELPPSQRAGVLPGTESEPTTPVAGVRTAGRPQPQPLPRVVPRLHGRPH